MKTVRELINGTPIEPRPYQARIVEKALDLYLAKELRSVLVESPTGSGKTVMGLLIARALQETLGLRIGWVAMRRNLLAQTADTVTRLNLPVKLTYLSMFDKNPATDLDMLIVDEAQHDAAGSMAHLHDRIRPQRILGLSATPYRADKVKLCFDAVLKDAGIAQLILDGYLSKYDHFTLPTHTPESVTEAYCAEPERWGQSIVFFHTLPQCVEAQERFRNAGIASEVVTGSSDRETQIERFTAGEVPILINCMVLAEGFDCPALKTVFCRPSGKGTTLQMCGRAFRKHPELPVKNIVQCKRTAWPFSRTAAPRCQYVRTEAGAWRTLNLNPLIDAIGLTTLKSMAGREVKLPSFIKERATAGRSAWHRRIR